MRPVKLTMQAFGSYGKRTVIDFEKTNQNLFLITGDTGAGKSTIVNLISRFLQCQWRSRPDRWDRISRR